MNPSTLASPEILDNDTTFEIRPWTYAVTNESVVESSVQMVFTVFRGGVLIGPASVNYATSSGTATPGLDYQSRSGTLRFASGQNIASFSVSLLDDRLTEGNETFTVNLSNPSAGASLQSPSSLMVTVMDNDDDGPGSLIPTFAPTFAEYLHSDYIDLIAIGPEGDIFIAGTFTNVNHVARDHVARLNVDGSLDAQFRPQPPVIGTINAIGVEPDGRVLVGGTLGNPSSDNVPVLRRTLADGSIDTNFNAGKIVNGRVEALARADNGRWLVAGGFTEIGGAQRTALARLTADGTVDAIFNPVLGVPPQPSVYRPFVYRLATQANEQIFILGNFNSVNGVRRERLARLNADGSLDESFTADLRSGFGVGVMAVQPDGKLLVNVSFYNGFSESDPQLARLNVDGSTDQTFRPVSVSLRGMAVLPDGRIIIVGDFGLLDGWPRAGVARLFPDGSLDPSFDVGGVFNGMEIHAMAVEASGDVLLGGFLRLSQIGTPLSLVRLRGSNSNFLGRFELRAPAFRVWETNGVVPITIYRQGGSPAAASVRLTASSGTASNDVDFVFAPTTVEFAAGETSKTVEVVIVRDAVIEPPEDLVLTLSNPVGAILGSRTSATLTILDHPGGLVDSSFNVGGAAIHPLIPVLWLPGEKLLMSGQFPSVDKSWQNRLGRFNADGSRDTDFDVKITGHVASLAVSGDGKIYLATTDERANGMVTRLLPHGSIDPGFKIQPDTYASAMVVQPDGKLVLNRLTNPFSNRSNHVARLNEDGSYDAAFYPALAVTGDIGVLVLQAEGKILVGGPFTSIGGIIQSNLARLHPDGRVDVAFAPAVTGGGLSQIVLQPDGRILVAGSFTAIDGVPRQGVTRLNADGTLDFSFMPPVKHDFNLTITAMALQGDGKILIAGPELRLPGRYGGILRLDANGLLDPTFDPDFGYDGGIRSLLVQADGKVIVGGSFASVNGGARSILVRLLNDDGVGAGRIEFAPPALAVDETASVVTLTVRRAVGSRGAVTVGYGASGGTATAGADFSAPRGTIRFEDGETAEKSITVPLHDDLWAEGDETLFVYFANPIGGATISAPALVTLRDNETVLEFAETNLWVRENAQIKMVSINRLGSTNGVVTVHVATRDGTARAGLDYVAQDRTLTFADGEVSQTFALPIIEDREVEADEVLDLLLSNPSSGTRLGTNTTAHLTITDNDRPGLVDDGFDASAELNYGLFYFGSEQGPFAVFIFIDALAVQPDGRILVAGAFADSTHTNLANLKSLVRLMPDGSRDESFAPDRSSNGLPIIGYLSRVVLQPDGKVLVTTAYGQPRLVRLHDDGRPDESFRATILGEPLLAVVLQPDGKIIIGGSFTNVNGINRHGIARLNSDGSLDTVFGPDSSVMFAAEGEQLSPGTVNAVALQADGRILIGGRFNQVNGVARDGLARLTDRGAVDLTFDLGSGLTNSLSGPGGMFVSALALQPDGLVQVAGCFTHVNGIARANLVRLHADGKVDLGFDASGLQNYLGITGPCPYEFLLALQPDGRILVAAYSGESMWLSQAGLVRLNLDGSLDEDFRPRLKAYSGNSSPWGVPDSGSVRALVLQPDGQILLGGEFLSVNEERHAGLVRINGGALHFEFYSLSRLVGGATRLTFVMPRGQSYQLQASRNLLDWTDLNLGRPLRDKTEFIDAMAADGDQRFYRARQSP